MEFSRRDLLQILGPGLFILALLTFLFARRSCVDDDLSTQARANAEARCQEHPEPAACLGLVERHHDICARKNNTTTKHSPPSFDDAGYAICLELGPDGARKLKKAKEEAARRENTY